MNFSTVPSLILRHWHTGISPNVGLVGIALVGLFVRLLQIDAESVWLDEAFSIWAAQLSFSEMMEIAEWDPHPPLHYLLLKGWMGVFGTSETAVRSLSAVLGAGAIWGLGQLFFALRQVETGLYAAGILTFAPIHVWYSQETRSYALFFFAAVLATATLLRVMREPNRLHAAFYIVAATLAFYSHAYSFFLFVGHLVIYVGAFVLARDEIRLSPTRFVALHVAIGLACLPWVFVVMTQAQSIAAGYWITGPTMDFVLDSYSLIAGSETLLFAMLGLGAFALFQLRRKHEKTQRIALLAAIVIAPIFPFGAAIASWAWKPIFLVRAAIPALIGLIILAAVGVAQITPRIRSIAVALLMGACAFQLHTQMTEVEKEDWRAAVGRVNKGAAPGDIVILDAGFTRKVYDYYSNRTDVIVLQAPDSAKRIGPWLEKHNATLDAGGRVWHLQAHSRDTQKLIPKELATNRTKSFSAQHWGVWVMGWDVNETQPAAPT